MIQNKEIKYAGFWIRIASISIDSFFLFILYILLLSIAWPIIHSIAETDIFFKVSLYGLFPVLFLITPFYYT